MPRQLVNNINRNNLQLFVSENGEVGDKVLKIVCIAGAGFIYEEKFRGRANEGMRVRERWRLQRGP